MRTNIKACFIGTALSLACTLPAMAQQAGTYTGTTDDGNFVQFTVTKDGGNFTLTEADVNFAANCKKTGDTANEGWGFGVGQPITNGKVIFVSKSDYYNIAAKLKFPSKNKITGTVESRTAIFKAGTPPKAAQYCISKSQGLTATFQGPARAFAPSAESAIAFAHPANVTARTVPAMSR